MPGLKRLAARKIRERHGALRVRKRRVLRARCPSHRLEQALFMLLWRHLVPAEWLHQSNRIGRDGPVGDKSAGISSPFQSANAASRTRPPLTLASPSRASCEWVLARNGRSEAASMVRAGAVGSCPAHKGSGQPSARPSPPSAPRERLHMPLRTRISRLRARA